MSASSPDPWLGQFLGEQQRYRLDQPLGNGAIGDVYLTTDMRLERRVAIKILKGALAKSKELVARFEREISVLAALESEHIVQVLDYGITAEGHPFYVMEYLKGQTLSQLMRRSQRLSVDLTVRIATQICEGLRIAHEGIVIRKGGIATTETVKVIHRDLKPANIFMVPTAMGGLVKVLDFGIAKKLYASEQPEQTNLTQAFLGTYHYAAPEQLRNARNLDERADIYSLGLILYEMLSGTDPFGIGSSQQPNREMSWAMAHASSEPRPLRQQPGCERIPASIEAAVMRCLQKPAADRFASVTELSRALTGVPHTPRTEPGTLNLATLSEEATAHSPIGMAPDPTVSRPLVPDSTLAQSANEPAVLSADQTIAQVSAASPQTNPPVDQTIAQASSAVSPDVNSPIDQTIPQSFNTPFPPANLPIDQTIAQASKAVSSDTTRIQTPPGQMHVQNSAARKRLDETLLQIPARSPAVDQTLMQVPQSVAPTVMTAPPLAPIANSRRSWQQLLLPLGIGFALGMVLMLGAYLIWRSQLQKQQTSSHRVFAFLQQQSQQQVDDRVQE
jgi:eukaryotic-like serine/threonine-protein kinase